HDFDDVRQRSAFEPSAGVGVELDCDSDPGLCEIDHLAQVSGKPTPVTVGNSPIALSDLYCQTILVAASTTAPFFSINTVEQVAHRLFTKDFALIQCFGPPGKILGGRGKAPTAPLHLRVEHQLAFSYVSPLESKRTVRHRVARNHFRQRWTVRRNRSL